MDYDLQVANSYPLCDTFVHEFKSKMGHVLEHVLSSLEQV